MVGTHYQSASDQIHGKGDVQMKYAVCRSTGSVAKHFDNIIAARAFYEAKQKRGWYIKIPVESYLKEKQNG